MSLNNFFKHKQLEEQKEAETQRLITYHIIRKARQQKIDNIRKVKSVQMKARADHRLEEFQSTQLSKQYVNSMKKGTYPLLPTDKHSFRDRVKEREMESQGGVYVKTFHQARERAELTNEDFRQGHLELDKFDGNLPYKNHSNWLRIDDKSKMSHPMRFGLGSRVEVQRVNNIMGQLSHQLDNEKKDIKMLYLPDWKEVQKEKWMDNKTFDVYPCKYEGARCHPPWTQHPINYNNQNNQYIDGFEVTGDLSRKRDKGQEAKKQEFCTTLKQDLLGSTMHISKSLRTMKADKIIGVSDQYDKYSSNQLLTHYKSALISTKSVDHVVPYCHSNNFQGVQINNLRPQTNNKLYKLSINMSNQQIITKKPPDSAEIKTAAKTEVPITPDNLFQKLTNIQEVSQYGVQSQSNLPQSRESLNSRIAKSRFMNFYKNNKDGNDDNMKLGYPYHQENDETTQKIVSNYFKE